MAKRILLVLALAVLLLGTAGCPSVPNIPDVPDVPGVDTSNWEGEWEEEWPGASSRDVYRIQVTNNGNTIQVTPITNAERQNLAELRWDGVTLSFTNYISNRGLEYKLVMDPSGNLLVGTVTMPSGDVKNIKWYKRGFQQQPEQQPLVPRYNATLEEWFGDWEEDWPNSSSHDRYRLKLSRETNMLTVSALTNVGKQKLTNVRFAGNILTFTLQFNTVVYNYTLVPAQPNLLEGRVTEQNSDKVRDITWRRVAHLAPPRPSVPIPSSWQGVYEEFWPNRDQKDIYIIRVEDGQPEIQPLTNESKQTITGLNYDGNELTFELRFNTNVIQYALRKQGENTLTGTATLTSGTVKEIAWNRLNKRDNPPFKPAQLTGTWEEYWPNSTNRDIYQLRVINKKLTLHALTNLHKQKIENFQFIGTSLSFKLTFGENSMEYYLNIKDSNWIHGTVKMKSGKTREVNWIKINDKKPPTSFKAWNGIWEEHWPNRSAHDVYRLTATSRTKIKVEPLTNVDKQKVVTVEFDGKKLFFVIRFKQKLIEYHLVLQEDGLARGTAVLSDGTPKQITWKRTGS